MVATQVMVFLQNVQQVGLDLCRFRLTWTLFEDALNFQNDNTTLEAQMNISRCKFKALQTTR